MVFSASATAVIDFYFTDNFDEEEGDYEEDFVPEEIIEEEEFVEEQAIVPTKRNTKPKTFLIHPKSSFDEFTCAICMTDYSDDPTSMVSIEECSHKFCKDCISNYITFKTGDISCIFHTLVLLKQESKIILNIEHLKTYGIPCPGHNCRHVMQINELKSLGTNEALQQFERFSELHKNNLLLQANQLQILPIQPNCPVCHAKSIRKLKKNNTLVCLKCGSSFCGSCGKSHPRTLTCKEYLELKNNTLLMIPGLTRCPKCFIFVEKNGGCNFMTCKCSQFFCFLCGKCLTSEDHFGHFFNAPFDSKCKGPKNK